MTIYGKNVQQKECNLEEMLFFWIVHFCVNKPFKAVIFQFSLFGISVGNLI